MSLTHLLPNGNGFYNQFAIVGGSCSSNWECLDDPVDSPDEDTTRLGETTNNSRQSVSLTNFEFIGSINSVTITTRLNKSAGSAATIKNFLRIGSTDYDGSAQTVPINGTYANYTETWLLNPATSLPWTSTDLNSLEAGLLVTVVGSIALLFTQLYAIVDYTPAIPLTSPGLANKSNIVLTSKDLLSQQHDITDAYNITYSNHYSNEGSGFGFLSFSLRRKYGVNYNDIGFAYEIRLTKGLKIFLFNGIITKIEENNDDTLQISAVGKNTLLSFDILNFVLSDGRVNRWLTACNPRGSYRPDKFDHSLSWTEIINEGEITEEEISFDGIEIRPRRGIDYNDDDFYYIRYRFEFGETASRLKGTYKLALPNNWPGEITILDGDGNVLQTLNVSGNGTINLILDSLYDGSFVEIRFTITTAGLNTAEENTVYFRFYDILVLSTGNETVDAADVASVVALHMRDNYDFSADLSHIDTIGFPLPQAAYDADVPLNEIMNEIASFGDTSFNPLAWGVFMDDTDRMFLEVQDLTTVAYKIENADELSVSGDLTDSFQKVYGKYTDTLGQEQRSGVYSALAQIQLLGGLYKKSVIEFDSDVTEAQANQALQLALIENRNPKISTDFSIKEYIQLPTGGIVPIEEIRAGGIIQIPTLRAAEAKLLDDKRKGFYSFQLTAVEVNLNSGEATLTPAENKSSFEKYMTTLKKMANR